eukprot:467117-Pyramimonas_sp.AAC.1
MAAAGTPPARERHRVNQSELEVKTAAPVTMTADWTAAAGGHVSAPASPCNTNKSYKLGTRARHGHMTPVPNWWVN